MEKPVFIADRYEILGKIGSGGMSDVYKAKDHKLNRFVAIKVLKPEFSEDRSFVTKFRVEAQSAAGLIHANIVNVYDVGDEDGIYYIVMELVEGITLKKYNITPPLALDDIDSPAKLVPGIPVSVEKIVLKCTQKRTERRYQTMSDLIADLKHSLVAPNEDFVVMRPVASNGPTKMITEDELDMIHQMSSVKSTNISSRKKDSIYDDSDDEMDDEMDDDNDDVRNNHDLDYYDDDDDDSEDSGSSTVDKVITALGISVAVIIVIITIFIIFKMVSVLSGSGNQGNNNQTTTQSTQENDGRVEVPLVTGYNYEDAQKMLNDVNLGVKLTYDNSSYDAGMVIEQNVTAGSRVKEHTTIVLTVSSGPESFSMIDVDDMTEDGATEALYALGLKVKVEYVESSEVEQFRVISSTPKHLAKVKQGDEVTLYISMGDGKVYTEVPNLLDKTEDEAKQAITSNGFVVGTIKREGSATVAVGHVIAQSGPAAGEKAAEGSTINFVVSTGTDSSVKYVYLSKTVLVEDLTSENKVPEDATFIRLNFVLAQNGNEKNIASQEYTSYAGMTEKSIQVRETLSDFSKGSAQLRVFAYYVSPSSEQTVQLCTLDVTLTE